MSLSSAEEATVTGNITGVWNGFYGSDKIHGKLPVVLMFQQLTAQEFEECTRRTGPAPNPGETVVGVYKSTNGAIGTMVGSILGATVTLAATQATPTCSGSFDMHGTLNGDEFNWDFQGADCLGDEKGSGKAKRS